MQKEGEGETERDRLIDREREYVCVYICEKEGERDMKRWIDSILVLLAFIRQPSIGALSFRTPFSLK